MNEAELDKIQEMDAAGETELRGPRILGSEQIAAVDHLAHRKKRNPDVTLHLDGESDSLYTDGLDVDANSGGLFGTKDTL